MRSSESVTAGCGITDVPRKERVVIQDVSTFVPELVAAVEAAEAEEE
jgi:hypothetical protein